MRATPFRAPSNVGRLATPLCFVFSLPDRYDTGDRATASLGNTYTGLGSIAGVVLMSAALARMNSALYPAAAFAVGTGLVLLFAWGPLPNAAVPTLLLLTAAALGVGGVGQTTIATALYPAALRSTGVGWSSAMGRAGSIIGPGIAGFFLHLDRPARDIIALAAIPALASAAAAGLIAVRAQRGIKEHSYA